MDDSDTAIFGNVRVRERDGSMVLTVPAEAADFSGLMVGEDAIVAASEDGNVCFLPADEGSIREMLDLNG